MDFKSSLLPRAAALALGTAGSLFQSAYRNYSIKVPKLDTAPPMAYPRSSRRTRRAYRRKPMRLVRRVQPAITTVVRTSPFIAVNYFGIGATTVFAAYNPALSAVFNTDLQAAWDLFRIRKVQVIVTPLFDPGNSGIVNNDQLAMYAACDPSTNVSVISIPQIGAYQNHKARVLVAGKEFVYTFYPKAVNSVFDGTTTQPAGSYGMNPWLQCNATGVTIPHQSLQLGCQTNKAPSTANTEGFQYYVRLWVDLKNIS